MKKTLLAVALAVIAAPALACAPAPECWMKSDPAYLKSICSGYAKDHQTVAQIATYVEQPQKVPAFVAACKRLGVTIR
jgi:hypothetical protein